MPDGAIAEPPDWPELDAALAEHEAELAALARKALEPDPPFDMLDWTVENRVFDDASSEPGEFDPTVAPYLNEPMRLLSPGQGTEEGSIIKPAQSGGSVILESFLASIPVHIPGPAMAVHPTVKAFKDWAEEKWWPMVYATKCLDPARGGQVRDQNDKTAGGSKADRIRFANGAWIAGAGANSAATLRQKSIRYMILDDLDGFDEDADGEGDPERLAHQRTKTYRRKGLAITIRVSTPLLEGGSRIMKHYEKSDRRRFYHRCKSSECRALFDFDWEDIEKRKQAPFGTNVACPSCGTVHTHGDKRQMQIDGAWIPTAPVAPPEDQIAGEYSPWVPAKLIEPQHEQLWAGRDMGPLTPRKGWWITGVMNFAETWDSIAQAELDCGDDPKAQMVFANTILGRPFRLKTKMPEWEALSARRNIDFHRGAGVAGPSVFILSADVQSYGIYYLIKGYDRRERGYYLDWGLISGETSESGKGAWEGFTKIFEAGAPLPGAARIEFDSALVDAKYNTPAVKDWCRRRPNVFAINGQPGWRHDVIVSAERKELTQAGRRRRYSDPIWHIGTYSVKQILAARYARTASGKGFDETGAPAGYCWFPDGADEPFFRQLTSEYVAEETVKSTGHKLRTWKLRSGEENHLFDCDVYNLAGLHKLGARIGGRGHWDDEEWNAREARITAAVAAVGGAQGDLFDARPPPAEAMDQTAPTDTALSAVLKGMAALNKQ